MQLVQQKGKKEKVYALTATGLTIQTTVGGSLPSEETVPFENIRHDRFVYQQISYGYLACGGVFFLITVLNLLDQKGEKLPSYTPLFVWSTICLASVLLFFLHRPRRYFLKTFSGNYIRFNAGCDDVALEQFIKELLKKRAAYLRLKYTVLSVHLTYEGQYSNLNILHREGVLSTEEFTEKITELNTFFSQTTPRQVLSGFSQN